MEAELHKMTRMTLNRGPLHPRICSENVVDDVFVISVVATFRSVADAMSNRIQEVARNYMVARRGHDQVNDMAVDIPCG